MNSSARPNPELLPYNARSEVINTMYRIGHVFIMARPRAISVDVGDVDTSCRFTDRVYAEMADEAGGLRYRFLCPGACAGRQPSLVFGVEALPQGWRECCPISMQLRQEQRHVTTHGWNRDRQTAHR
jgi:hypothetical protein